MGPTLPIIRNLTAHVAQLAEHFLGKEEVMGSIPVVGSIRLAAAQLAHGRPVRRRVECPERTRTSAASRGRVEGLSLIIIACL